MYRRGGPSSPPGIDEGEHILVRDQCLRDGDEASIPLLDARRSTYWGDVQAIAVLADVDLRARRQAQAIAQGLWQDDPSDVINCRFHWDNGTSCIPVCKGPNEGGVTTVPIMATLKVEVDAAEVGFDAERLARIDRHFEAYVDDGRLPGWHIVVTRGGEIAHCSTYGMRDKEAGLPIEDDTIYRIFSMTKPITSVAAMMLYEQGRFELKDPVSKFIPSFENVRVYKQGSAMSPVVEPAVEPVRMWHLLTHTSGLTYGFHHAHPVDAMYRTRGFEWGWPEGMDLAAACDAWADMPLLFQPGSEWNYGVSTDVLGRVVEVITGKPLDEAFDEMIINPLGMDDTKFWVPEDKVDRLAALYVALPGMGAIRGDTLMPTPPVTKRPTLLGGGGGLVGTTADYHRFTQMLLRGGELDGTRLLGSRTLEYMTRNHLPGGADLEEYGRPLFSETTFDGVGFGLGFSVVLDPEQNKVLGSAGEFAWGGAASTAFWVDPAEEITAIFMTQLLPSSTHPIRTQLKQLVQQALID